jgi:hypothetical protein
VDVAQVEEQVLVNSLLCHTNSGNLGCDNGRNKKVPLGSKKVT